MLGGGGRMFGPEEVTKHDRYGRQYTRPASI